MPALNYQNVNLSPTISLMQVPSRWVLVPFWSLYKRRNLVALAPESEELLSVYRDYGVVRRAGRKDNFNKPSEDLSKYQLVQPGDLVINKMKAWQGSLGVSEYRGLVSPAYFVYQPVHAASHSFLHHLFRSDVYAAAYGALSKGIRVNQWDLDPHEHSRLQVLLPPLAEQHQIASFLNHETSRIDALIAEQQRLIELLQEKRQAVISQAVTKGLDPSVPMKDSGVEWLGDVPEHWSLGRLKHLVRIRSGHDYKHVQTDDPDGFPVIGSGGPFARAHQYHFSGESVLLGRKGTINKPLYVNGAFWTVDTMFYTEIDQIAWPKFVYYLATIIPFAYYSTNTALPSMSQFDLANHRVVWPCYSEQRQIASLLDEETSRIDALIDLASEAIELLFERRSALISAAVTGKIDVRNWQPPANDSGSESAGELVHG